MKYQDLKKRKFNLNECKCKDINSSYTSIVKGWGSSNINRQDYFEGEEGIIFSGNYFISISELERTGQLTEKDLKTPEYELY